MKASELRIGNWINAYHSDVQVTAINSTPDNYLTLQLTTTPDSIGATHGGMYYPIPLSEEWLLKFGFYYSDNGNFLDIRVGGSILYINPNEDGVCWIVRDDHIFNVPQLITYVHQLQNLFYSLTGEELTIKE